MAAKNPCTCGIRITGCVATLSAALALATAHQSVHFSNVNVSIQVGYSDLMCYICLWCYLLQAIQLPCQLSAWKGMEIFMQGGEVFVGLLHSTAEKSLEGINFWTWAEVQVALNSTYLLFGPKCSFNALQYLGSTTLELGFMKWIKKRFGVGFGLGLMRGQQWDN
ncbi:hypothetical protein SO802_008785 [Lithocarpus litseifolius]|uniref:Uncharacterized protein n=1 Tax=Lithocarpus litseifolius TaxID=425828 RepID=A0AAW2DCE7_9ROSI